MTLQRFFIGFAVIMFALMVVALVGHEITYRKLKATCIEAAERGQLSEKARYMCLMQGVYVRNHT